MFPPKRAALLIVSLMLMLACALPAATASPDSDAISTYIAQTMTAAAGMTDSAVVLASPTPQTPTPTLTPGPPTLTHTASFTVTPFFTATPLVPLISVSVATNCRSGPGKVYEREGALLVGETAEVLARDPTGNYWYIRNPDSAGDFCWVWGYYATLTGNWAALPIYTPPPTPVPTLTPTPAPNFTASYEDLESCSGDWWVSINLKNTGPISFRSLILRVEDQDTDVQVTIYADGFTDRDGCSATETLDILAPDKTFPVRSGSFDYNPTNHDLEARITLCSATGQGGTCVTRTIDIEP